MSLTASPLASFVHLMTNDLDFPSREIVGSGKRFVAVFTDSATFGAAGAGKRFTASCISLSRASVYS